jgi:hypothetical protein
MKGDIRYFRLIESAVRGTLSPYAPDRDSFSHFDKKEYLSLEEIKSLIKSQYTKAKDSDILNTICDFEDQNVLKRVKGDKWKLLLPRKLPENQFHGNVWRRDSVSRNKPGVCPSCGVSVQYKNRHARSGSLHTGDDCSINKIKSVMGV